MSAEAAKAAASHTLKVRNKAGADAGTVTVDEAAYGGMIKNRLMHSAAVMYQANVRAGTHCTKTRAEVAGSNKKLYRQKGTGRARAGSRKAGQRKHGGIIHGPKPRRYGFDMPKKQRRAAVKSAVLSKVKDAQVTIVDSFGLTDVKTKAMYEVLKALGLLVKGKTPNLLIITDGADENVYRSARNIEGVEVLPVQDLNALEALNHQMLVFTKPAFDRFQALASRTYEKKVRKLRGTRKAEMAAPAGANAREASGLKG